MNPKNCLFCKIAAGTIPAKKVLETSEILVFEDIHPKAPIHLLAIPKKHLATIMDFDPSDAALLAALFLGMKQIAAEKKMDGSGFRLVVNNGADAGQEVDHLHFHMLAGRKMSWPPG
jgi:diadenosine tetraphosphate (Ap4A) HIT family hydrolase